MKRPQVGRFFFAPLLTRDYGGVGRTQACRKLAEPKKTCFFDSIALYSFQTKSLSKQGGIVDEKIKMLKKKGVVLTIQRLAVLRALEGQASHPTAEEIHRALRAQYPTLSLATVYNALETLKQAGLVHELVVGKEKRFDALASLHHHFYCRMCGRIYDVPVQCPVANKGWIEGHRVENSQAVFSGVCATCLCAEDQGEAKRRPYRCTVCGWVYDPASQRQGLGQDTSFALLPEGWRCQVCGASRDKFVPAEVVLTKKRSRQGGSSY